MGNPENIESPAELVQDAKLVENALAKAVSDALRFHKRAGNAVPVWEDGKVRWLPPEEIPEFDPTSDD